MAGLFAGIGGFERGLEMAGHETVLLCENDASAATVLRSRFPGCGYAGDIRRLCALPRVDVVTAGFPCQDLSQAGRMSGIDGSESRLISEVFRLLRRADPTPQWVVLENVPFMLHLDRGRAMRMVIEGLEMLGLRWAYRIVDSRWFGLPQRRRRVILLASGKHDPRDVLLADDTVQTGPPKFDRTHAGFYWTEGTRGLGWVLDGIPPLKGGSGIGIPSPPAIWDSERRVLITPDIRDAERLQGFAEDWTVSAAPKQIRWALIGNAVSVPVAEWLGRRLIRPGRYDEKGDRELLDGDPWPTAAWGFTGRAHAASVSDWPIYRPFAHIAGFLKHPGALLSERATAGFLRRAQASRLHFADGFIEDVEHHLDQVCSGSQPIGSLATAKTVVVSDGASPEPARPRASSSAALVRMQSTRQRNTGAELALRSALWGAGLRGYRVNRRPIAGLRRTADIVFASHKVAVFVDGCFWHACPRHASSPRANSRWWRDKIAANEIRDNDTNLQLTQAGWTVVRVWEHSQPTEAAQTLMAVLGGNSGAVRRTDRSADVRILAAIGT